MKRSIIFTAITVALAFLLPMSDYVCYIIGAMVAVMVFNMDDGDGSSNGGNSDHDNE